MSRWTVTSLPLFAIIAIILAVSGIGLILTVIGLILTVIGTTGMSDSNGVDVVLMALLLRGAAGARCGRSVGRSVGGR